MRELNYYVCPADSALGKALINLIERMDAARKEADKLAQEKRADEWEEDTRYAAGGIGYLIYNHPPKAKKTIVSVREYKGQHYCVPNPNYNCGLRFAKKVFRLPKVEYKEVFLAMGIDINNPQYKDCLLPRFLYTDSWVHVCTDIDLSKSTFGSQFTVSTDKVFEAAVKYVSE